MVFERLNEEFVKDRDARVREEKQQERIDEITHAVMCSICCALKADKLAIEKDGFSRRNR